MRNNVSRRDESRIKKVSLKQGRWRHLLDHRLVVVVVIVVVVVRLILSGQVLKLRACQLHTYVRTGNEESNSPPPP